MRTSVFLAAAAGLWALTGMAAPAASAEIGLLDAVDQVLTTPEGIARVLAIEAAIGAVVFYWLWRSRHDHAPINYSPGADSHEEVRRYFALVIWLSAHALVVFTAGGIFAHQDSAWFATSVQQSGIMPAHRLIFFVNFPAYLIIGGGAYYYARIRLPELAKRSKLAFAIAILAPFSFIPAFGSSFLDHTYDLAESIYVAFYGLANVAWVILGMGTLLLRSLRRIAKLTA